MTLALEVTDARGYAAYRSQDAKAVESTAIYNMQDEASPDEKLELQPKSHTDDSTHSTADCDEPARSPRRQSKTDSALGSRPFGRLNSDPTGTSGSAGIPFGKTLSDPGSCTRPGRKHPSLVERMAARKQLCELQLRVDVRQERPEGLPGADGPGLSDHFELFEKLGQGSTGCVHRARRKRDGEEVAVKIMRATEVEMIESFRQEHILLSRMAHPNIIKSLDFFVTIRGAALVLELFSDMTLTRAVKKMPGHRLPEGTAQSLCRQLVDALMYLHAEKIVHRDIKPDNLLVSPCLSNIQLIDFNVASLKLLSEPLTMTGTYVYTAPEVLKGESPTESNDIWGAGMCLYFMLRGRLPWRSEQHEGIEGYREAVATRRISMNGAPWEDISEACKSAVRKMLVLDPGARPTAWALAQEDWFLACNSRSPGAQL
eukprot:TRINITY_DN79705_c0_g1_i1.p1 TRINITY_DN79705_c0_g1~~TRINITY_DN79705_c0_g1_i1.p1  ORF type:complete len:439 (-),score=63.96 TRINITY_DN79705_c0_g1_i1:63-1349(-)